MAKRCRRFTGLSGGEDGTHPLVWVRQGEKGLHPAYSLEGDQRNGVDESNDSAATAVVSVDNVGFLRVRWSSTGNVESVPLSDVVWDLPLRRERRRTRTLLQESSDRTVSMKISCDKELGVSREVVRYQGKAAKLADRTILRSSDDDDDGYDKESGGGDGESGRRFRLQSRVRDLQRAPAFVAGYGAVSGVNSLHGKRERRKTRTLLEETSEKMVAADGAIDTNDVPNGRSELGSWPTMSSGEEDCDGDGDEEGWRAPAEGRGRKRSSPGTPSEACVRSGGGTSRAKWGIAASDEKGESPRYERRERRKTRTLLEETSERSLAADETNVSDGGLEAAQGDDNDKRLQSAWKGKERSPISPRFSNQAPRSKGGGPICGGSIPLVKRKTSSDGSSDCGDTSDDDTEEEGKEVARTRVGSTARVGSGGTPAVRRPYRRRGPTPVGRLRGIGDSGGSGDGNYSPPSGCRSSPPKKKVAPRPRPPQPLSTVGQDVESLSSAPAGLGLDAGGGAGGAKKEDAGRRSAGMEHMPLYDESMSEGERDEEWWGTLNGDKGGGSRAGALGGMPATWKAPPAAAAGPNRAVRKGATLWDILDVNRSRAVSEIVRILPRHINEDRAGHVGHFFLFCHERQCIWERRNADEYRPWTEDERLHGGVYCNVYRELDRGTAYFRAQLLKSAGEQPIEAVAAWKRLGEKGQGKEKERIGTVSLESFLVEVLWLSVCYRLVNKIETFEVSL